MRPIKFAKPINIQLGWQTFLSRVALVTTGAVLGALSVIIFFAPSDIAPSGTSGVAVILNTLYGTPIGVFVVLLNLPILYLAYRQLGGLRAVLWTGFVIIVYSIAIDVLTPFFPPQGVTDDTLVNAIFAGVLNGIGHGLVLRGGGTYGGTATIARIIQVANGTPLSTTYLYANLFVVGAVGVFLGWENALFTLIALAIEGSVSDYTLEGPSVIRNVTIITNNPNDVANVLLYQLHRGVTGWEATGMYTGEKRHILFVTVSRPQVGLLRQLVLEADPTAFMSIGQGHVAYGGDFKASKPRARPGVTLS